MKELPSCRLTIFGKTEIVQTSIMCILPHSVALNERTAFMLAHHFWEDWDSADIDHVHSPIFSDCWVIIRSTLSISGAFGLWKLSVHMILMEKKVCAQMALRLLTPWEAFWWKNYVLIGTLRAKAISSCKESCDESWIYISCQAEVAEQGVKKIKMSQAKKKASVKLN